MSRVPVALLGVGLLLAVSLSSATAADTKWVRGTVSAVAGDSVTVTVKDKAMTFKVDASTDFVGRGGGTAQREAEAAGKAGVQLAKLIKVGERVEVHYQEMAGTMKATEIRAGISAPDAASGEQEEGKSARGKVTAVAGDSLTVKGDAEWTFMVDAKTRIIGTGLGTMSREMAQKGKAPTLADSVKVGDEVVVSFHDMAGKMHATEVRVVRKGS